MNPQANEDEQRRQVLHALRMNGRASYSRIATEVGTTRQHVTRIVQEAIERDELRLTVSISSDLLGLERFAYLQIVVNGDAGHLRDSLVAMPETTFVADISGEFSLDAEVRVGPDPHLRDTIEQIRNLPGVTRLRTLTYESIEANLYSPLRTGRTGFVVDDADRAIVRHLQRDGRAAFRELGKSAGISPSGARLRFERLARAGAIKVVGIPVRRRRSETPSLGIGAKVQGDLQSASDLILSLNPEFLAIAIGEYDLIATISADTVEELMAQIDSLRDAPDFAVLETWANLRIVKEQYGEGDQLVVSA